MRHTATMDRLLSGFPKPSICYISFDPLSEKSIALPFGIPEVSTHHMSALLRSRNGEKSRIWIKQPTVLLPCNDIKFNLVPLENTPCSIWRQLSVPKHCCILIPTNDF